MSDLVQYLLGMIGAFSFTIVVLGVIRIFQKDDTEPNRIILVIGALAGILLTLTVGVLIVVIILQLVIR